MSTLQEIEKKAASKELELVLGTKKHTLDEDSVAHMLPESSNLAHIFMPRKALDLAGRARHIAEATGNADVMSSYTKNPQSRELLNTGLGGVAGGVLGGTAGGLLGLLHATGESANPQESLTKGIGLGTSAGTILGTVLGLVHSRRKKKKNIEAIAEAASGSEFTAADNAKEESGVLQALDNLASPFHQQGQDKAHKMLERIAEGGDVKRMDNDRDTLAKVTDYTGWVPYANYATLPMDMFSGARTAITR